MLHKRFFHQMEEQEEMTIYLPGPTFLSHFYDVTFCITFLGKSCCILI